MYTVHVISSNIDGGASAPVGPSVATPLAVPIPGISIGPILAYFDGTRISQVCYTSTISVVCAHELVFSKSSS